MTSLRVGTVSAVDAAGVRARVRLPECDNLRTAWLEVLQRNTQNNKDYWLPDVGEQVRILLDDNGEDGVILGAIYSSVDTPPVNNAQARGCTFSDGAAFYYDRATHTLTVNGGIQHIVIETLADVVVKTPRATVDSPDTTFTGNVLVQGKLTYQGDMVGTAASIQGNVTVNGNISASGSVMDAGGNSNHHSH